jgi:signal transduction histidine kinase
VRLRSHRVGLALSCLLALLAGPLAAQDSPQQRVLALYVTTPGAAGAVVFDTTFQAILGAALGARLDFHSEYIDLARFSESTYPAALAEFLAYKYARLRPAVVLATTEASRRFAEQYRSRIFPDAAIVFIDRIASADRQPASTGVSAALDLGGTIDLALALQPDTEQVFVVSGVSTFDRFYERLAREQLQRFAGRVAVNYWTDKTLAELERGLASLPPKSVIFFLTFGEDRSGARFVSLDVRDRVGAVANAPMYAWNQVAMNHGIVGGRLFTNEIVARRAAELALRILRGEPADGIPLEIVDSNLTQVDWREIQRWNIAATRIPASTLILFREPTLWDRYKFYISSAMGLVFLQTALIAGLLVQRARRRRAEAEMRAQQAQLAESNRQITELFGRLIGAQEAERSRIARDLHDDVSQRVAALSIAMSSLKRKVSGTRDDVQAAAALSAMQRDAAMLAEGIRLVSHNLHPSVLQHAGLVTALTVFCKEFATLDGPSIRFTAAADVGTVDGKAALCLYRVTQEALNNAAKHAHATTVTVSLARARDVLHLSIADDGRGFDLAGMRARGAGLGLTSMDERVRLLGGQVVIETRPGGGTRVLVELRVLS